MVSGLEFRLLTWDEDQILQLQKCFEETPQWAGRFEELPLRSDYARDIRRYLPDGTTYADKFTFGIYFENRIIGCADIYRHCPNRSVATLGLLVVSEKFQRKQIGSAAYAFVENEVRKWQGIESVVCWINKESESQAPFWEKLGYRFLEKSEPFLWNGRETSSLKFAKSLIR